MSLPWKVYDAEDLMIAACRSAEDAAATASRSGAGSTVRHGGHARKHTVWMQGAESAWASGCYEKAAGVMQERVAAATR